ncbi:MAG TPA: alpha/beta fold hydrolase [Actinomycetota bacterium]|nr:alpha/beta fold hydrolase [Actinomycetota bacterium]
MTSSVRRSIERLPERFRGSEIAARYRLNVDDDACEVVVTPKSCHIEGPWGEPDAEITTDAETWRAMQSGRLSGIEAFADRRLVIRGSIEKSLHFEPSFERPKRGGIRYSLERIRSGRGHVSALVAGDRRMKPLVLIHGLGATKASWLTVVPQLSRHHRVIALDLPGFGASSKPNGSYCAAWFADRVFEVLDRMGIQSSLVAGNSMGGRVAMEMAMQRPERLDGIACLCPAAAFSHRPAIQLVRLVRPELGVLAGRLPRAQVMSGLKQLFARPERLHDTWYEAAVDDFLTVWRSPRARIAFARSLRNIYLDEPLGDSGFWQRLARVETPALFVYGKHDALITHHFAHKMRRTLPHAHVKVWNDCGHVPQIEFPQRTVKTMIDFFAAHTSGRVPRTATGS